MVAKTITSAEVKVMSGDATTTWLSHFWLPILDHWWECHENHTRSEIPWHGAASSLPAVAAQPGSMGMP